VTRVGCFHPPEIFHGSSDVSRAQALVSTLQEKLGVCRLCLEGSIQVLKNMD
jgi:hypothetical protein